MHTKEGQPETGSPYVHVLTIITIIIINASKQNRTPAKVAIIKGAVEKAVIPSQA